MSSYDERRQRELRELAELRTVDEAREQAYREPLPATLFAEAAMAQIILGRHTANTPDLLAGMLLVVRERVKQVRGLV